MKSQHSAKAAGPLLLSALRFGFAVSCFALVGCAPIPPPHVLDEADAVALSPSAQEAKKFAPSAFAAAEKLRAEAHAALKSDRIARVQILAEQAIAAYEEASALGRVARAERTEEETSGRAASTQKELDVLKAQLDAATLDVDGLELQLKVVKDAEIVTPSGPAIAEREAARRQSAHAMLVQAKLLCTSARIIAPPQTGGVAAPGALKGSIASADDPTSPGAIQADLSSAEDEITKLQSALDGTGPTPIDLATRARANCLSVLERSRRSGSASAVGATSVESDTLLTELSAFAARVGGNMSPERDERGIAVTLRSAFDGDHVADATKSRLSDLDRVALAHPKFAIAIVLHSDSPIKDSDAALWSRRADALASFFPDVAKDQIFTLLAGNFAPLVDPHGKDKAQNNRVEIIFIPRAL